MSTVSNRTHLITPRIAPPTPAPVNPISGLSFPIAAAQAAQNRIQGVASTPGWTSVGAFEYHAAYIAGFKSIKFEVVAFPSTTALQMRFRIVDAPTLTLVTNSQLTIAAGSTAYQEAISSDISAGLVDGTIFEIQMEVTGGALTTDFGTIGSGILIATF